MDHHYFNLIMQEVLKQKQLMEHLNEENRQLRRQLADLYEARGIFVEIGGKRFALVAEPNRSAPTTDSVAVPVPQQMFTTAETIPHLAVVPAPLQAFGTQSERVVEAEGKAAASSSSLEETMSNTVAPQVTSPMPLRLDSADTQAPADEDGMGALRHELAGSFILARE